MSTQLDMFTITVDNFGFSSDSKTVHVCREVITPLGYSKVMNDKNEVAVLICPKYGGGWSTSYMLNGPGIRRQILVDSRIIRYMFLGEYAEHDYNSFMQNVIGLDEYEYPTVECKDLAVVFIPEGTQFRVNEYDGSESIEIYDPKRFQTA